MTDRPIVSVIVLSHRFELAIDAMRSVKAQTYPEDRVELLLKHSLRYYPAKFNQAWQGAEGKYLVFLPDDDTLEPNFVERLTEVAEADALDFVYSDHYVTGRLKLKWWMPDFDAALLRLYAVPWMTFLVRTEFWRAIGGWDGSQAYSDWDAGIRMLEAKARAKHLKGEFLWNRSEHRNSGSWLMDTAAHDEALRQLREKHSIGVK